MNFRRENRIKVIKGAILLALFIFTWSSSNLFYHSHIVNSEVVTHSHPYTNAGHSHSGVEMVTVAMLSLSVALIPWVALSLIFDNGGRKTENYQIFNVVDPFSGSLLSLRAPPAVC